MRDMSLKVTPVFLPVEGKDYWFLLLSLLSLLSLDTTKPKNTYSCIHPASDWSGLRELKNDKYQD